MSARIRKGDMVEVITGKYRGQRGRVTKVNPETQRVVVERLNLVKRHQKPNLQNRTGGIVEKEAPIALSNVMLVHNGERTRVGFRVSKDGAKQRWSKKHREVIDA
jgi:large subunit ribosomal protein L24